ncbi:MAG: DUF1552 domain-containing protein [Nevskiaceae bacterium]|jgi:hypothetical protein|nr:DUF1552 domain-containing protein [Nevskiaceae bacterium]
MILTKKHISRRAMLRGAGVALGLPLLDAMIPAATAWAQTAAKTPPRFFGGFVPHGGAPGYWVPETAGALAAELPFIWKPLEPFRDALTVLSGLHSTSAEPPPGETGADHWVAAAFLCADKPRKTAGADVYAGQTIDQIIAQHIGRESLLPSMEISVEDPGSGASNCGEGYSCVYTNTIAWTSPTTPLPMELNPQVVFERMFGSGSSPEQRMARRARNQSILDSITGKISTLRGEISVPDRHRLDGFTENVREIERRLQIAASATTAAPEDFSVPPGIPQSFDEHIKLMFDLLALAWQADISRVGTMLFARDLTGRVYPESEAPTQGFHGVSHHGEDPALIKELSKINQYHVKMLAYFVDKLSKTNDGDGSLLDHSLLLYGSNMGNPNQHLHYDVPHILLGGNYGKLKGGRHLAYPTKTVPTGNLLLSLLDQFGIERESIGDSTGRLDHLV